MTTIRTLLPAHTLPRRVTTAMTATVALAAAGLPLAAVLGLGAAPAAAQPPAAGTISTVAGSAGGPAKATKVAVSSCGLAYRGGQVRIADGTTVRTVNARTDWLTTAAGNDAAGPLGDGGPASAASLGVACGVAVDHAGNLLIADAARFRIRVVAHATATFYGRAMTAGDIYTIAGDGTQAFSGDGGPATAAGLQAPYAVAVDKVGNLVLTDGDRVRVGGREDRVFLRHGDDRGTSTPWPAPARWGSPATAARPPAAALGIPRGRVRGPGREPADRRQLQRPGASRGGEDRHVLPNNRR